MRHLCAIALLCVTCDAQVCQPGVYGTCVIQSRVVQDYSIAPAYAPQSFAPAQTYEAPPVYYSQPSNRRFDFSYNPYIQRPAYSSFEYDAGASIGGYGAGLNFRAYTPQAQAYAPAVQYAPSQQYSDPCAAYGGYSVGASSYGACGTSTYGAQSYGASQYGACGPANYGGPSNYVGSPQGYQRGGNSYQYNNYGRPPVIRFQQRYTIR